MGVSKNRGYPQNGWFIIENPIRMIWGYHYFRNSHIASLKHPPFSHRGATLLWKAPSVLPGCQKRRTRGGWCKWPGRVHSGQKQISSKKGQKQLEKHVDIKLYTKKKHIGMIWMYGFNGPLERQPFFINPLFKVKTGKEQLVTSNY